MVMLLAVSSGALEQATVATATELRFQSRSSVKLAGNDSSCSFDPGVSKACGHWCLQPEWTSKGAATGLSCCSGHAGSGASDLKPYKLVVAYLYTSEERMLRKQLGSWAKFSEKLLRQLRFLLAVETEGLSFPPPSDILQQELGPLGHERPDVRLVGVQEHLDWNIGGKRNLLMHVADTWHADSWVLLTDIDIELTEEFLTACLEIAMAPGSQNTLHKFQRQKPGGELKPHPGTWLMKTGLYWKSGGCDEDFVGWYGNTDPHFDFRAKATGISIQFHMGLIVHEMEHLGGDKRIRNTTHNDRLLAQKKNNLTAWSNRYLRFGWGLIACEQMPRASGTRLR